MMTRKGDVVRLTYTTDRTTDLVPGDEGEVAVVDSTGTVHVRWNSGSRLGLVPGEDHWEVVRRNELQVTDVTDETLDHLGFDKTEKTGPAAALGRPREIRVGDTYVLGWVLD